MKRAVILGISGLCLVGAVLAGRQFVRENFAAAADRRTRIRALEADVPASEAHNPAVSLARFVTIDSGNKFRRDDVGYWRGMAGAISSADAPIDIATGDCTFFDKDGSPIASSSATFHDLQPGERVWDEIAAKMDEGPASVRCRVAVAYNRR